MKRFFRSWRRLNERLPKSSQLVGRSQASTDASTCWKAWEDWILQACWTGKMHFNLKKQCLDSRGHQAHCPHLGSTLAHGVIHSKRKCCWCWEAECYVCLRSIGSCSRCLPGCPVFLQTRPFKLPIHWHGLCNPLSFPISQTVPFLLQQQSQPSPITGSWSGVNPPDLVFHPALENGMVPVSKIACF